LATVARVLRSGASRHRSAEAEPMKRAGALRQGAKRREQYGPPLRCFLVGLAATMEGSEAKARSDYLNRKIREAAGMD
jgi:hypothetical protein